MSTDQDKGMEKPRMLFLSGPWDHLETVRKVGLVDPVTRLLEHHFDLVTVSGDQDYGEVVEKHAPDIVMFDSGCDTFQGRTPVFTNTHRHPAVPKVGFVRQDFHSPMRLNAYGRMDAWGVEQFFSPSYPYQGAPRAWRDRVIFIPRWVDTTYFRDWGETKCIPVAMLGAGFFSSDFYPWRRRVAPQLVQRFPFIHAPRPMPNPHMIVGENYGRMINRSFFTVGCGGASRSLVSKLFEIPGARSILVTEDTAIVRDAGFVDGENCVLTDEDEVADRLAYLLDHSDELEALTERSYQFAHTHHTHRSRDHINQWLALRKTMPDGHHVIQESCMKPLRAVPNGFEQTQFVPFETSTVTQGISEGFDALQRDDYGSAEEAFEKTLGHYNYMLEGHLGMGIALLGRGELNKAVARFARNVNFQTACHAVVRDPVNQAYLALTFLGGGNIPMAVKFAARAPRVKHPALGCVRWLLAQARPGLATTKPFDVELPDETVNLCSLDPRPVRSSAEWLGHFRDLMATAGQDALVAHVDQTGLAQRA